MDRPGLLLSLFLVVAFVAAACSAPAGTAEPTTTAPPTTEPPTTTTTSTAPPAAPETTTTDAPLRVDVVGTSSSSLASAVTDLYSAALDDRNDPGTAPEGLVTAASEVAAFHGEATRQLRVFQKKLKTGDSVAVVHATRTGIVDEDLLFAYTDDGSWHLAGGRFAGGRTWLGDEPLMMMAIGSDAREGQNQEKLRADSLHMITLAPDASGGAVIGFPRDTLMDKGLILAANEYVGLPADLVPSTMKWTHVMARRGPEIMVGTAQELTGLDLAGYVVVGFKGYKSLVKELGGILIDLPRSVSTGNDWKNFSAGLQRLIGNRALHLARARKGVPGGDFGRSANQGLIILAGMEMVQGLGIDTLPAMIGVLQQHGFTDLTTEQLLLFTASAYLTDADAMENTVIKGKTGRYGLASVVFLNMDHATSVFADVGPDGKLDGLPKAPPRTVATDEDDSGA